MCSLCPLAVGLSHPTCPVSCLFQEGPPGGNAGGRRGCCPVHRSLDLLLSSFPPITGSLHPTWHSPCTPPSQPLFLLTLSLPLPLLTLTL